MLANNSLLPSGDLCGVLLSQPSVEECPRWAPCPNPDWTLSHMATDDDNDDDDDDNDNDVCVLMERCIKIIISILIITPRTHTRTHARTHVDEPQHVFEPNTAFA